MGVASVAVVALVRRAMHGEDPDDLIQSLSRKLAALESNLGIGVLGDLLTEKTNKG